MARPAKTRLKIIQAIEQHGPQTKQELMASLLLTEPAVRGCLQFSRMGEQKVFYICAWKRYVGQGGNIMPVYNLGDLPDVPAPVCSDTHMRRVLDIRYKRKKLHQKHLERAMAELNAMEVFRKLGKRSMPRL